MADRRERVPESGRGPSVLPPWSEAVSATEQQHNIEDSSNTEVGAFEPLPDSPTGRGADQKQLPASKLQQSPPPGQQQQQHHHHQRAAATTQGPFPGTAHLHLIGEIAGAVGLGLGPLYCTWQLVYDAQLWSIAAGQDKGRTHASSPQLSEDGSLSGVVWECPMDILLITSSRQHWPSIVFKLFHRSIWLGRDEFVGYSLCSLPNTPGCHHVSCPVWVAAEGRRSLPKELTTFFTGLHPQLVDESFITDLEQRFEQGQHLHTVACSSGSTSTSSYHSLSHSRAMVCTGGPGAAAAAAASQGALSRAHCSSLSGASSGAAAVTGSGICLRLHVLTRGLEQLSRLRGDGAESIGRCLERLHSSVEKIRKQHARPKLQDLVGVDSDEDSQAEATEESRGLQLVREGRGARLEAVHQQLFGQDGDRDRNRDQRQLQQLQPASRGLVSAAGRDGSPAADRLGRSPGRLVAGRSSVDAPDSQAGAGSSPGRQQLRSLAALPEGTSSSSGASAARRLGGAGAGGTARGLLGQRQPLGGSAGSSDGAAVVAGVGGSPLRRDAAAGSSRWAGRFATAAPATDSSPVREELLPQSQERS